MGVINPKQEATTCHWVESDGKGGWKDVANPVSVACCKGQTFPCDSCRNEECERRTALACMAMHKLGNCCYYDYVPDHGSICRCSVLKTECSRNEDSEPELNV